MYQGQFGADFGPLSLDGVISWAKDAVSLSTFGGSNNFCIKGTTDCFVFVNNAYYNPNSVLKATLSNDTGLELAVKYKWNTVTFYGGYLYANLGNPSDSYLSGFPTIAAGISFPPATSAKAPIRIPRSPTTPMTTTGSEHGLDRFQMVCVGQSQRRDGFLLSGSEQLQFQRELPRDNPSRGLHGNRRLHQQLEVRRQPDAVSLLVDYRPVGRVDLYAGVMLSNVYGGLASGFTRPPRITLPLLHGKIFSATATTANTQEWDPTVGIRIRF